MKGIVVTTKTASTVSIPEAGAKIGIGRAKSYELAKRGEFPVRVLKVGQRYRVPTADLDRYLGIEPAEPKPAA